MAMTFVDGFDHYVISPRTGSQIQVLPGWSQLALLGPNGGGGDGVQNTFGRCGSNGYEVKYGGLQDSFSQQKNLPIVTEYYAGIAINVQSNQAIFASTPLFGFGDGSVYQTSVHVYSNGTLALGGTNGTVLLGQSNIQMPFQSFHFIELHAIANTTTGFAQVRLDNQVILTTTNVNTAGGTGVNQFSSLILGSTNNTVNHSSAIVFFDDLYVLDTTGSNAWTKTYLGDTRIRTLMPTGNGSRTAWSANGAAQQWQCVNEITATGGDGDTTYIADATAGDIQYFTFGAIPTTSNTVWAVACLIDNRKDDGLVRTMSAETRSPATTGVESTGTAFNLPTSYGYNEVFFETDPNTSAQWTATNVNAAEFGVKDVS